MNEEQPFAEKPIEVPLADMQRNEIHPLDRQSQDPRHRLRELLAIPDCERTDASWDEIIGLEIQLASGNRALSPQAEVGRPQESGRRPDWDRHSDQARRQQSTSGTKQITRFFKKRKRGPRVPT